MLLFQQTVLYNEYIIQHSNRSCWKTSKKAGDNLMTNEKLDRRKKYTRMVLKESLMTLLQEKQIFSITVKEICELSDINRSTFYAHYDNPFDLLEQIEQELIDDLNSFLSSYNFSKEDEALNMTEKLIEYFATKQKECQILLSKNSHSSFEQNIRDIAKQYIMQNRKQIGIDYETSQYVSAFIIKGSIEVMKVWLHNNMDTSPKEIAKLIIHLSNGNARA